MEIKNLEKSLEELKKTSIKRNFVQSIDLIISLKNLDLKKPENRIKAEISIPVQFKPNKIGIFADTLIPKVKELGDSVILIRKEEIESYGKNKRLAKKLAKQCNSFIAEPNLMASIGKNLGPILAPRNKMPKPIPPNITDLKPIVEREKSLIKIFVKDSPVIQCSVGKENMKNEDIIQNIKAIIDNIEAILPNGKENIKNIYLKLTMGGKPIKLI
ncbi:MAG: 50S ribosomal protein L1 [Candidatus Aenigmatarchaeota archaeon]